MKQITKSQPATTVATPAPAATQAAPATQAVVKPNARAHLRNLFDRPGKVVSADTVFGIHRNEKGEVVSADYHAVTIKTHLTDFKNKNYCGKLGILNIVKLNDGSYKRLDDAPATTKAA
jgi:hypothetical protein